MKKKILLPLILVATLIFSIAAPHLSSLKTAFAAVEDGKVVVTGLTVDKNHVTAGEKVAINVTFEGGKNVQPNTTLEIDLPQKSTNLAGLYGVNTSFTINGVYNEGQTDQKEVKDIATVQIKNDKATVTFNDSVKELPNGFTGLFTFNAEAQLAQSVTEGSKQTTITVDGKEVTITIDKDQTTNSSGTNPNAPIDDSKEYVGKYGEAGKSGNINWVISGATSGGHTDNVVITDIPSGVASKIETDTFIMTIRQNIYASGSNQATSSQTTDYNFESLQKLGYITLKDDGGFVITMPAWMLNNSQWEIRYRAIPTEEIQEGQVFDNKVSVTTNEKTFDTSYQVVIKQGGSGEVNGSGSSSTVASSVSTESTTSTVESSSADSTTSTTESSTDSTESTTSSTEEITVPEESTTSSTEETTVPEESTTSSTEEITVPEESTTGTTESSTESAESTTADSTVDTTDTTSTIDSTVSSDTVTTDTDTTVSTDTNESTTVSTDTIVPTVPTQSTTASDESSSSSEAITSDESVPTSESVTSSEVASSTAAETTDTTTSVRQNGSNTTIVNRSTSTTTTRTSSNSNEEGMLPQTGTKRAIGLVIVGVILVIGIITYVVIRRRS